jgi:hypothetical protein
LFVSFRWVGECRIFKVLFKMPVPIYLHPEISYLSGAEIQVAVISVGPQQEQSQGSSLFERLASLVTPHRQIELANVRSFYKQTSKSPFKFFPWKSGSMHFRFVSPCPPSPLSHLHAHRRVLGVIGIASIPSCRGDAMESLAKEFESRCRDFPEALTFRCLVFESAADSVNASYSSGKLHPDLVIFPRALDDQGALKTHMEVVMQDFAACFLAALEEWMLSAASPSTAPMSTPLDPPEAFPNEEEATKTKRRYARAQKIMGDVALLAGSPLDAADHYTTAAELARVCMDHIWSASAMEGYLAAKLLHVTASNDCLVVEGSNPLQVAWDTLKSMDNTSHQGLGELIREGRELIEEIRASLRAFRTLVVTGSSTRTSSALAPAASMAIAALVVESELRWARLLIGLLGQASARAEVSYIARAVQSGAELLASPVDRQTALTEAALLIGSVGSTRKRSLLLWQAVELGKHFGLSDEKTLDLARAALFVSGHHADSQKKSPWSLVRAACLESTLGMAILARKHAQVWDAASTLLREHYKEISTHRMQSLIENLAAAASQLASQLPKGDKIIRPTGPGPLLSDPEPRPTAAQQDTHPPHRLLIRPEDTTTSASKTPLSRDQFFLYDPFTVKRKEEQEKNSDVEGLVIAVVGETISVDVWVSNPTAVGIRIERMVLMDDEMMMDQGDGEMRLGGGGSSRWRPKPVSLNVPPNTKPVKVRLEGTPLSAGKLVFTGCKLTAFGGVTWFQRFPYNRTGNGNGNGNGNTDHDAARVMVIGPLPLASCYFDLSESGEHQKGESTMLLGQKAPAGGASLVVADSPETQVSVTHASLVSCTSEDESIVCVRARKTVCTTTTLEESKSSMCKFPLEVEAKGVGQTKLTAVVEYAGGSLSLSGKVGEDKGGEPGRLIWGRLARVEVTVNVVSGVVIDSIAILESYTEIRDAVDEGELDRSRLPEKQARLLVGVSNAGEGRLEVALHSGGCPLCPQTSYGLEVGERVVLDGRMTVIDEGVSGTLENIAVVFTESLQMERSGKLDIATADIVRLADLADNGMCPPLSFGWIRATGGESTGHPKMSVVGKVFIDGLSFIRHRSGFPVAVARRCKGFIVELEIGSVGGNAGDEVKVVASLRCEAVTALEVAKGVEPPAVALLPNSGNASTGARVKNVLWTGRHSGINITVAPEGKVRRRIGITILEDGDGDEKPERIYRIVPEIYDLNGQEDKISVVHPAYVIVESAC